MSFIALRGRGPCTVIVLALAVTLALTPAMPASAVQACPHANIHPNLPGGVTLDISPICISPDDNRLADSVTIHGTTGGGALDWTVIVTNGAGEVIDKIIKNGADATLIWDGRNTAGQRVAEGTYTMQVQLECEQVMSQPPPTVLGHPLPPVPGSEELSSVISFSCGDAEPIPVGDTVNYLLASTTITVDLTAPAIQGFTVSNPAFSPNGDGVKDSTAFSATLDDASASWTLRVVSPLNAALRSFEGTGATVAATWDGTDGTGAAVAEGTYRAILTATDAAENTRADAIEVINDITPPVVSSMSHPDASDTLMLRPTLGATISDASAGIDGGASQLRLGATVLSTFGESVVGSTNTRSATGQPATALTLDADQHWSVQARDMAGNTVTQERLFRVVNVHQEPLSASIAPVTATAPVCPVVPLPECTLTFNSVVANFGTHDITISSSAHRGQGLFTRPVSLSTTKVRWQTSTGTRDVGVDLAPTNVGIKMTLDDAFTSSFTIPAAPERMALGDVTVHVPPDAVPGSIATLEMPATTVAPSCVDTSAAPDARTCGGSDTVNAEPLPDPYQVMAPVPEGPAEDNTCDAACEAYLASVSVPAVAGPLAEDGWLSGTHEPLVNGDVSWAKWTEGEIVVKAAAGEAILSIVAAHGGVPTDVAQGMIPPFDAIAQEIGLDRWYVVTVPVGTEKAKVQQYVTDPRVEYAHLSPPNDVVPLAVPDDPGVQSTCSSTAVAWCGKQWNLSLGTNAAWAHHGIWPEEAWAVADGEFLGSRRIETAYVDSGFTTSHEDLDNKIRSGFTFPDGSKNPDGTPRNDNFKQCYGSPEQGRNWMAQHGTWVMGMNTVTGNGTGLSGVNKGGFAIPIQYGVTSLTGPAPRCTPIVTGARRAQWINKGVALGAEVINVSYASPSALPEECEAIHNAYRKGVIVVTGEPYGGSVDAIWPSSCIHYTHGHDYKYQLVVAATTETGQIWESSRARLALADLAAPGTHIWTVGHGVGACDCTRDNEYTPIPTPAIGGTSVAAPQVAGLVHLLTQLGVPRYVARNAPRTSATRIGPGCNGSPSSETCYGKIQMSRAVRGEVRNGVFEVWNDIRHPASWTEKRDCESQQTLQGSDNSPGDHGYSMVTSCRNGPPGPSDIPRLSKISTVRVTPGWKYQFIGSTKRSDDNPSSSSAEVEVCFSQKDPRATPPHPTRNPSTCKDSGSDSESLKKDVWSSWAFQTDKVPGDETGGWTWAQVKLRTYATSAGTVSWDDVGFFAIGT